MRLCWHKWIKQHETPGFQVCSGTLVGTCVILFLVSLIGFMISANEGFLVIKTICSITGIGSFVIGAISIAVSDGPDDILTVTSLSDRVCTKCGKSQLDYTNQQLAEKRAKDRLNIYTQSLKEMSGEDK